MVTRNSNTIENMGLAINLWFPPFLLLPSCKSNPIFSAVVSFVWQPQLKQQKPGWALEKEGKKAGSKDGDLSNNDNNETSSDPVAASSDTAAAAAATAADVANATDTANASAADAAAAVDDAPVAVEQQVLTTNCFKLLFFHAQLFF